MVRHKIKRSTCSCNIFQNLNPTFVMQAKILCWVSHINPKVGGLELVCVRGLNSSKRSSQSQPYTPIWTMDVGYPHFTSLNRSSSAQIGMSLYFNYSIIIIIWSLEELFGGFSGVENYKSIFEIYLYDKIDILILYCSKCQAIKK